MVLFSIPSISQPVSSSPFILSLYSQACPHLCYSHDISLNTIWHLSKHYLFGLYKTASFLLYYQSNISEPRFYSFTGFLPCVWNMTWWKKYKDNFLIFSFIWYKSFLHFFYFLPHLYHNIWTLKKHNRARIN